MHVGNNKAICSDAPYISESEDYHYPRPEQAAMFDWWVGHRDNLKNGKPLLTVVNGEPCDGNNRKSMGKECWSNDVGDQKEDFKRLIKFLSYQNVLLIKGSGYHSDSNTTSSLEEEIAREIGALPYSGYFHRQIDTGTGEFIDQYDGGKYTDVYAQFKCFNRVFNITHHIGFTKWFSYRPTALGREMAGMVFEDDKFYDHDDAPNVMIRSHAHYFVEIRYPNSWGMITSAWKYPDDYLFRGGIAGTTPDVGMTEIIVEPNEEILVYPHIAPKAKMPKPYIHDFSPEYSLRKLKTRQEELARKIKRVEILCRTPQEKLRINMKRANSKTPLEEFEPIR